MKKTLLGLAAIAATAGASAQSSVTIFGTADLRLAHGSGATADKTQLTRSGLSSTRFGIRGTEDLGGGLMAGFWLEADLNMDDGTGLTSNTNNQATGTSAGAVGLTFNRRSTVSLAGSWGELRLGRDYSPHYWNITVFDPFGTIGVGASQMLGSSIGGIANTLIRASNSIGYLSPGCAAPSGCSGFYGQALYYMGENASNVANDKDGTGASVRLGYGGSNFNLAAAYGQTDYAATATAGRTTTMNIGGSYNFGVAQVIAAYQRDTVERTTELDGKGWLVGAVVPVGAGRIRGSVSSYETDSAGMPKVTKYAVGYVYNLSKRTSVYTTYARLRNSGGAAATLNGATGAANASSSGYDIGINHVF